MAGREFGEGQKADGQRNHPTNDYAERQKERIGEKKVSQTVLLVFVLNPTH